MSLPKNQFPECDGCINAKFDQFQCIGCKKGSNFEAEEITDSEFDDDAADIVTFVRDI
jgi:hypothetical protein